MTAGRSLLRVGAGGVVVAALAAAAGVARPTAAPGRPPQPGRQLVTSSSYVCPSSYGSPTGPAVVTVAALGRLLGDGPAPVTLTTAPLTGAGARTTSLPSHSLVRVRSTRAGGPVVVTAHGRGAGAVAVDQRRLIPGGRSRGLLATACLRPGTDWWITGADGRVGFTDDLVLANPGTTTANVTVRAWASTGPLQPPKLQAFTLGAGKSVLLPVADYTPDAALVSLHVHANSGRVTATVRDQRVSGVRAAGVDWIAPAQPPSRDLVVPGVPAGAGQRRLVLANPGRTDATVTVRLVTTSGDFSPAGHPTVLVRAGRTAAVDLTDSLDQAAGAVVLSSDQPVTAAAVSQTSTSLRHGFPDIQWHPAGLPITTAAVLPDSTPPYDGTVRIYLTAPHGAGRMRLTTADGHSRTVDVRPGRTVIVDPVALLGSAATGPLLLRPAGGGPVWASRSLYFAGAHGPLTTAEQPILLPTVVRLPPVAADLTAGLR